MADPRTTPFNQMNVEVGGDPIHIMGSTMMEDSLVQEIIRINPIYQRLSLVMPPECPFSKEKPTRLNIPNRMLIGYIYSWLRCILNAI